jgi:hypothetical protein
MVARQCEFGQERKAREMRIEDQPVLSRTLANSRVEVPVRVSFVHSQYRQIDRQRVAFLETGRLRQLADWLALSLKRTVTLCELSVGVDIDGQRQWAPIAQGFALCHWTDQFVKRTGRALALKRALHVSLLDKDQQRLVWESEGFTVEDYANARL